MANVSLDTPLYNSRIFNSYLKLLKERYFHVSIPELLSCAGMSETEIVDPNHWFTQRQVNLFHDKLVQLSGNPRIAREAGRYAASPGALGMLRHFALGLAGPEYVFSLAGRIAANFSRSSRYSTSRIARRELEVLVTFEEGVQENPNQCQNRIGFFEAVFLMFGYGMPEIQHEECIFNGATACRYRVRWEASAADWLTLLRRLSCALVVPVVLFLYLCSAGTALASVSVLTVTGYLLLVSWIQRTERSTLLATMANMHTSGQQLLDQIKRNYDSALMINEVGEIISRYTDLDQILDSLNQVLCKRLDYRRGLVLLPDSTENALVLKRSFGLLAAEQQALKKLEFPLRGTSPNRLFSRCYLSQEFILGKNLADLDEEDLTSENYAFFNSLGVKSFICAPLLCEGESLGVLAVDDWNRDGELRQKDLNLLQGLAPVLGIAIRNAMRLSNERNLSDQLRKASELLERRVEERTAELSRANEELEFLYDSMSHDLRTPLRVIYGYGDLLLDLYGQRLDETGRQYLKAMITGGEQMEATLDRMLDFSEVKLRKLMPEQLDLSELAHRILRDLQITDPARRVQLDIENGLVARGDRELLTSILENLLGNAWKYSAGGEVTEIGFGLRDGVFYVKDNGAGFDMGLAHRLFVPFQRLHDSSRFPGHGLGLAMVRSMVQRLGGEVWAYGAPGAGATFHFTLGSSTAAAPPSGAANSPNSPSPQTP
jgi:signal transduction histidine kinase